MANILKTYGVTIDLLSLKHNLCVSMSKDYSFRINGD